MPYCNIKAQNLGPALSKLWLAVSFRGQLSVAVFFGKTRLSGLNLHVRTYGRE